MKSMGRGVLFSLLAALVVFCVVQDRVTAEGARRYVALQRAAAESGGLADGLDEVMRPAIRRSVAQGLLWGGVVMLSGLATTLVWRRRS
jgi:hypothetical protein